MNTLNKKMMPEKRLLSLKEAGIYLGRSALVF